VPVVVRQCSWNTEEYFKAFHALPKAGRPVAEWPHKDQAFHDVEVGLRKTIAEVRKMLGENLSGLRSLPLIRTACLVHARDSNTLGADSV
jgi:hypothetical protein